MGEWVDFAHWWSCIGKGLCLQPAQQACFHFYIEPKGDLCILLLVISWNLAFN